MASMSTPVPMVTRVRLKNFRSIAACDVALGPLAILVGPNGSGKSNFLKALDFLADALNTGLEAAVRRQGGIDSMVSRWALDDPDTVLSVEIDFALDRERVGYYALALRQLWVGTYEVIREHARVADVGSDSPLAELVVTPDGHHWDDTRGSQPLWPTSITGVFGPPSLTLPHLADHPYLGEVYRAIRGVSCYSLHVSEMRRPQEPDGGELLRPDGSNIASVFDRMTSKDAYGIIPSERLVEWLQVIAPEVVTVRAAKIVGYMTLQFEQHQPAGQGRWEFHASEMSYGTLRTLGVLVALMQGRMRDISPVTLVGIEEPESAVHPGAATAILEAMIEASRTTQILATTHSAAMLDHEDIDVGIVRAVELQQGRTVIGTVDEASRRMLEEHLASPGELLRMRHLSPAPGSDDSARTDEVAAPA